MILRRIMITRKQLESLPESERALFFFAGHALNELSMLWKLWQASTSVDEAVSKEERQALDFQHFALGRFLASKIYEARKGFKSAWNELQKESGDCGIRLSEDGAASYRRVNQLLDSGSKPLSKLRNNGGFHYAPGLYEQAWQEAPDEPGFDLLFGGTIYNNLNATAERAAVMSQLQLTAADDLTAQANRFLDELIEVSSHLFNVLESAQALLIERMLGREWPSLGVDEHIQPEASLSGQKVSYFLRVAPED